jgi:5'-3' exonuclease
MGIPHFFAWLLKNYKKDGFVFSKNQKLNPKLLSNINSIDYFLIDANSLIHPICFKTLAENQDVENNDRLEDKMINNVIAYIEKITEHVDPKKGLYIAIDGVAPLAKIKQQRMRRFKSVADKHLWDNIKKKHNKPILTHWNNNAVTPGTEFMEKLHNKILQWAQNYNRKVFYSSCFTPAEGEHKILQFIRNKQKDGSKDSYVIYGLDADLIFLTLTTDSENTYLLRESNEISKNGSQDVLNYVSMNIMRESIINTIRHYLSEFNDGMLADNSYKELDDKKLIDDFIFMCYFLGNDFLPHIPSLDIQHNGIETLIIKYTETINEFLLETNTLQYMMEVDLNSTCNFNQEFLVRFINKLSEIEEAILRENYASGKRYLKNDGDEYEKEMFRIENLQFKIVDPIKLGSDNMEDWRKRYYSHYWGVQEDEIEEFSKKLVENYIIGVKWVALYYFKECASWSWYFPFDHPPFMGDIAKYLTKINNIKFRLDKPVKPFVQLLAVLPPQSNILLPTNLRKLMINPKSSLISLYPTEFEQDFLNKSKHWKGIPNLPPLDIDLIKHCYLKYMDELSKNENERNKMLELFEF